MRSSAGVPDGAGVAAGVRQLQRLAAHLRAVPGEEHRK